MYWCVSVTGTSATAAHTSGLDSTHMNLKHFELTKGVGLLRLLQRAGHTVLLVAEEITTRSLSKLCSACKSYSVTVGPGLKLQN